MGRYETMTTGVITPALEAVVRVELHGTGGLKANVDAVIDTGFTDFLALPTSWITALALSYLQTDRVVLADGSDIAVDQYECTVIWEGHPRAVIVHCLEGTPLIGMSLLYDHLLTMQVVTGGVVTITPVP
jgi:clan AA aspartic protease